MKQIKAIAIKEGLGPNLAGCTFRINATGMGFDRKYFVKLLSKGTSKDTGVAWVEGQKVGAQ